LRWDAVQTMTNLCVPKARKFLTVSCSLTIDFAAWLYVRPPLPSTPTYPLRHNVISYLATYVITTNQDASPTTLITEALRLSQITMALLLSEAIGGGRWGDGISSFSAISTNIAILRY